MTKRKRKQRPVEDVITKALERALTSMENDEGHLSDWKGDALASWIAPGIIRTVKRLLKRKP
jgi:hypothetical protein